jgi:hypothetical protein
MVFMGPPGHRLEGTRRLLRSRSDAPENYEERRRTCFDREPAGRRREKDQIAVEQLRWPRAEIVMSPACRGTIATT